MAAGVAIAPSRDRLRRAVPGRRKSAGRSDRTTGEDPEYVHPAGLSSPRKRLWRQWVTA